MSWRSLVYARCSKYSEEFKATAVALSDLEGVAVQDVATELDIHPFMLSLWRKQVREGKIVAHKPKVTDEKLSAELRELRKMKKDYERLKEEHDIACAGGTVPAGRAD